MRKPIVGIKTSFRASYFYIGFFAVAAIGMVGMFAYKTPTPILDQSHSSAGEAEFGGVSLKIEYATSTEARERGLGGRESVPDDYCMLFVFPRDNYYGFWMKNMLLPIDIFWLDDKGQVVSIAESVATSTYPNVFYPSAPAHYVLETASGFARAHAIATGTPLLLKNFPTVSE